MPQKAVVAKGKSSLPKGKLVLATKKPAQKEVPPSKTLPKKAIAVVKEKDDVFVGEYQRVKECATCDCFELDTENDGGDAGFFHRKAEPQRVYLKHAVLKATRVKMTVEVLEEPEE